MASQAGQLGRNKLGGKEICRQSREKTVLGQPRRETNAKFSARRDGITSNLPYSGSLISQAPPLKYTGFPGVRSIRSDFQGLNCYIQSPPLNYQPSKNKNTTTLAAVINPKKTACKISSRPFSISH